LYGLNSAISGVQVFAICVILYAFASHWNADWDLTREGRRDLAPQTIQVLRGLDTDVEVVAFFTRLTDSVIDAARDKTRRFLDQTREYTSHLNVEFVDPVSEPMRLQEFGLEKERLSTTGTVVLRSGRRMKVLPISGVTGRLEERDFTNALINVARESQPRVYFLSGHNERDITQGLAQNASRGALEFKTRLENEAYRVDSFTLDIMEPRVPDDCDILVVHGPELPFRPAEIQAIQEFLDRGGSALFMLDPLLAPLSTLPAWLLERYGVVVGNDVLFSELAAQQPSRIFLLPDIGKIAARLGAQGIPEDFPGNFSQTHPITRGFDKEMVLEAARSVELAPQLPEGVAGEVILRSLPFTYKEDDLDLLAKSKINRDPDEPLGFPGVAVAVTAKTDAPVGDTGQTRNARLVVIGDGDLASNEGLQFVGHINFMLNTLAWLSESEELIAIRPTGVEDPPIILTPVEEQMIAWISTLGVCQVIVLAGLVVMVWRRRYQ
ncbi:MAG: GldG family protein, partial [Gammaproteobacteria bacterium]|nr:GldG family protein [Gammaproteobacteria bacterium]